MRLNQDQILRFWSKVDKKSEDECWPWLAGCKGKEGYGGFYLKQIDNTVNSHKIAFILEHNFDLEDIPKGIVIRHSCNNPICVNPKHLKIGTFQDNSDDMVKAGHSIKGKPLLKKRKITQDQAEEIRSLWQTGEYKYRELSDKFGICTSTISLIIKNNKYKDPNYQQKMFPHTVKKITADDVIAIRTMKTNGYSLKEIMSKFNIGQTQLYNIVNRKQWKDVP